MVEDARFEDASQGALNLKAFDAEGMQVISALVQDAVFPATEMHWDRMQRRFALLLNRFRWEESHNGPPERVRSLLVFEEVMGVASQGFDRADADLVLSVLAIGLELGDDGAARIELLLAGDGGIALAVEAVDVTLRDVTRPYLAPSGHVPDHGPDDT